MSAEKLHSGCSEKTHPPADRDLIIYITYSASRTILLHNARRRGGRREEGEDVNINKLIEFKFENQNHTTVLT